MELNQKQMRAALELLAKKLPKPVRIIIGGGGAMLLAHGFSLSTTDIDGIPARGFTAQELDPFVKEVADELHLSKDWLNTYFVTFTHVLPKDYESRLELVLSSHHLEVLALSKTDLLLMKCFAGRQKDRIHARELIRGGADISAVETQIENLLKLGIPKAQQALDFLDEVQDLV